jgi:hypothetical protein
MNMAPVSVTSFSIAAASINVILHTFMVINPQNRQIRVNPLVTTHILTLILTSEPIYGSHNFKA